MNLLADYSWLVVDPDRRSGRSGSRSSSCRGRDPGGCLVTIALGIGGAALRRIPRHQLGWYRHNEGAGFLAAIVGAMLILFVYRYDRFAPLRSAKPTRSRAS
jgi:uncharacterized membrane protein YeaQ/YmgE (transglycosylase-associated protein family)